MDNKIAIVTGANRGLGKAISEALAVRGVHVYTGTRTPGKADQVIKQINSSGGQATELVIDIASPESIATATDWFAKRQSRLDILVNNAGIFLENKKDSILNIPVATYQQELQVNVLGPLLLTNHLYSQLSASSNARVINMGSLMGQLATMTDASSPGYSISKTALNALTRKQAAEFADQNIDVNCMSPGWVRTDMGGPEANRSVEEGIDTVLWLAFENPAGRTGRFYQDRKEISW